MKEAMDSDKAEQWKEAAHAEYDSLQEYETWTLCDLPPNRKPVGSKWVFKVKARLVDQGFSQTPGGDFNETFGPVVRFGTIRSLLAMGVKRNMSIHQMDVTTAFLNGNLKEDIYLRQPEGFEEPGREDQVCHLHKSLYGLKQSPCCWYEQLSTQLECTGFKQSKADPCLFYNWESRRLTVISIYVDNLILLAALLEEMMYLKHQLSAMFKMTDMGNLSYCQRIGVRQGECCLQIQQRQYLLNSVKRFGLEDTHPVATPADVSVTLGLVDQQNYQQIIGSLLYASIGTRLDVTFIVGVLAIYCGKPNQLHLTAAKRVLRYLKGTAELALTYTNEGNASLTRYSDADWAGDRDTRRSTSGMTFMLQGVSITWSSKRQASVALSTVEAEYMALSQATQEAIWLQRLLEEVGESTK